MGISSGLALLGLNDNLYGQTLCYILKKKTINNERLGFGEKPFVKQTMKGN